MEAQIYCSDLPGAYESLTYGQLDAKQREIAERIRHRGAKGVALLAEVSPVITFGSRTPPGDLLWSPQEYAKRGIELYRCDRGGLATYHGPGQWVLFPVERLDVLTGDPRGVRRAVDLLLNVARDTACELGVEAEVRSGCELGVWTARGKLASVGIRVRDGVVLHGICVNGYRTEGSFMGIRPCGLDAQMDFLDAGSASSRERFHEVGRILLNKLTKATQQ